MHAYTRKTYTYMHAKDLHMCIYVHIHTGMHEHM